MLNPISKSLNGVMHWQFGTGKHSRTPRKIFKSTLLTVKSDQGSELIISQVDVDGSSQSVTGRNVASKSNIEHVGKNVIQCFGDDSEYLISISVRDRLNCIPLSSFKLSNDGQVPMLLC